MVDEKVKKIKKFLRAFSLVELMVTLITIAVITAAFTPTLSQKIKNSSVSVVGLSTKCSKHSKNPEGECQLCDKNKCVWCGLNRKAYKKYVIEEICDYGDCLDNCVTCINGTECIKCEAGFELVKNAAGKNVCSKCQNNLDTDGNPYRTYSSDGKKCIACKNGLFPTDDLQSCEACSEGHGCLNTTITGISSTVSKKIPCDVGHYASSGFTQCEECKKGTYQDQVKQASCKLCECGTFQNKTGATSCEPCGKDELCMPGSTARAYCNVGYGSSNGGNEPTEDGSKKCDCIKCKDPNARDCETPTNSTICKQGYEPVLKSPTGIDHECKEICEGDTFRKDDGECGCKSPFVPNASNICGCEDGKTESNGLCCPGNTKNINGQCGCEDGTTRYGDLCCPNDKEEKNGTCVCKGETKLINGVCGCDAPLEKTTDFKCVCPDGTPPNADGSCTCPPGQYRVTTGSGASSSSSSTSSGDSTCEECPKGSYCPGDDKKYDCNSVSYTNETGQTECKQCPHSNLWYRGFNCNNLGSIDSYTECSKEDVAYYMWWFTATSDRTSCTLTCPKGWGKYSNNLNYNFTINGYKYTGMAKCRPAGTQGGRQCAIGNKIYGKYNMYKDGTDSGCYSNYCGCVCEGSRPEYKCSGKASKIEGSTGCFNCDFSGNNYRYTAPWFKDGIMKRNPY